MLQLKKRDFGTIVNKLKKEFDIKDRHTGDWRIQVFYNGKLTARTKCSEGNGDIHPNIVQKIKKQLYFADDQELVEFKNCPLKCKDYLILLKKRNIL